MIYSKQELNHVLLLAIKIYILLELIAYILNKL